jgi:hypothetical protein
MIHLGAGFRLMARGYRHVAEPVLSPPFRLRSSEKGFHGLVSDRVCPRGDLLMYGVMHQDEEFAILPTALVEKERPLETNAPCSRACCAKSGTTRG